MSTYNLARPKTAEVQTLRLNGAMQVLMQASSHSVEMYVIGFI
jgi:hypothetical protein